MLGLTLDAILPEAVISLYGINRPSKYYHLFLIYQIITYVYTERHSISYLFIFKYGKSY